eukprot:scaffold67310_cov21-Tisochrysis_lutea.AAC.2
MAKPVPGEQITPWPICYDVPNFFHGAWSSCASTVHRLEGPFHGLYSCLAVRVLLFLLLVYLSPGPRHGLGRCLTMSAKARERDRAHGVWNEWSTPWRCAQKTQSKIQHNERELRALFCDGIHRRSCDCVLLSPHSLFLSTEKIEESLARPEQQVCGSFRQCAEEIEGSLAQPGQRVVWFVLTDVLSLRQRLKGFHNEAGGPPPPLPPSWTLSMKESLGENRYFLMTSLNIAGGELAPSHT